MLLAAYWWLLIESELCHFHLFKEKQLCCENPFCVNFSKEKQLVLLKLLLLFMCLVEEWFYSAIIGGIIDDSLLEANRDIVIYLHNRECTHEF